MTLRTDSSIGVSMLPIVSESETSAPTAVPSLTDRLNAQWHKPAVLALSLLVLAHWCVLGIRAIEVYVMGRSVTDAESLLGVVFSGVVDYAYALLALIALWVLRLGFVGRSRLWWTATFWIMAWVYLEYALLAYQTVAGRNLFGAAQPTCVLQMLGIFGRLEVNLLYGVLATVPMIVALYLHRFPSKQEAARMRCTCAVERLRVSGERETASRS
jgi:hypothetical protein